MTIIILGGGYAGLMAAAELGRSGRPAESDGELLLIERNRRFSEPVRRHQVAAGQSIAEYDYASHLAALGCGYLNGETTGLDPARESLTVRDGAGKIRHIGFELLIYALGCTPDVSSLPGAAAQVHTLGSQAAARRFAQAAQEAAGKDGALLIIGGGLTGLETATELKQAYPRLNITVCHDRTLAQDYSSRAIDHLRSVLARFGVALLEKQRVSAIDERCAHLQDGGSLRFDLCLYAGGVKAPALARDSGLAVDDAGRLTVDPANRSVSHPAVIAAGDAAAQQCDSQRPLRPSCATAMPQGRHAAQVAAAIMNGRPAPLFSFSYRMRCISLGRDDGLIQFVDGGDSPRDIVWTGEKAARMKDWVCRSTLVSMGFEDAIEDMPFDLPM